MQPKQRLQLPDNARILVVRRDNIGDLVCTTPLLRLLRETFPRAEIAALVNVYNKDVLDGNPNVDRVFVYQKVKHVRGLWCKTKALFGQIHLKLQLRLWSPSVCILARSNYDRHGLKYLRSMGARNVIGYKDQRYLDQPDIALIPRDFSEQHEVEFLQELLTPLGIDQRPGPLSVYPRSVLEQSFLSRLGETGCKLAVHISARDPERQWGIEHWCELTERLLCAHEDLVIALLWSPGQQDSAYVNGDDKLASTILKQVSNPRLKALPVETIPELVAAISACDGFVGADGGAMHLAVALHKPMVVLFEGNPQKWRHWYPWMVPAEIIKSPSQAIASIPLGNVLEATNTMIDKIRLTHTSKTSK